MHIENDSCHHFGIHPKVVSFCLCENFKAQTKKQRDQESKKKNKVTRSQGSKKQSDQGSKMRRVRDQKDKGHQGSAKTVSPKFPPSPGDEISQKMLDLARPSLREGVNLWGLVGKCEAVPGGGGE